MKEYVLEIKYNISTGKEIIMKSITLFTEEIDDIDLAMEELAEYLEEKNFTFLKNTCGIAFCDSEVEVEELLDAFGETFD